MKIILTSGTGTGTTLLSSFDNALVNCGVANYNLIPLSSIIPPHTEIVEQKFVTPESEWGHKLYVVKAEMRSDVAGESIGAGIGWYMIGNKGMFVEHETKGSSDDEVRNTLTQDITNSLKDLCKHRNIPWDDKNLHMHLNATTVNNTPTTTLVLAVYQAEGWK